jgi:methylase of polypeptide subunit release factors
MTDVRSMLADAGFDDDAVRATIGAVPVPAAASLQARRIHEPRAALVRLFVLGESVPAAELPVDLESLQAAGLTRQDGDSVCPLVRVTPYAGMVFAHDEDAGADSDFVTGVNNATRTLDALTVRKDVERALDLGTGCGVQALLATRHAQHVVATDVNARAVRYTELNCRLNSRPVDVRAGNLFEPLEDEQFDLIVSNPPYVISPDADYVFRDSGLGRDLLCREVVRGAAERLRRGGYATILCNWICRTPEETWNPLVGWVEGTGCDALLLAHRPIDPFSYAARWNEPRAKDAHAFSAAVHRWLAYYDEEGVAAIGFGSIVLRRGDADPWIRGLDLPKPAVGDAGPHLLRLLAATDDPLPADLTDVRLALVEGHRLEQVLRYRDEYELASVTMSLEEGVGTLGQIDARALPALFALDGEARVGEALAGLDHDGAAVAEATMRELYELGLLERRS